MSGEIIIPELGESIHDVRVARWFKQAGEIVKQDDDLVEIESEKATVVLPAPQAGRLASVLVETGAEAKVGQVIGQIEAVAQASQPEKKAQPETKAQPEKEASSPSAPAAQPAPAENFHPAGPDVRRALREHGLTEAQVAAEEPPGARLTRTSVEQYVRRHAEAEPAAPPTLAPPPPLAVVPTVIAPSSVARDRPEEVVPMSPLRRRIAERLVAAQHQGALLTTFNEIDMSAVTTLRRKYGEQFQQQHDVRLGFMAFFVTAAIESLKEVPALNAEVRGSDIVYKKYYDIGIAVGTPQGLVVPVVRGAAQLRFSEIERQIAELARRARENKLLPAELSGGTFTITNGGIFGSLLSTPIVNPPQTGILALHAIQDRPVAIEGQVVIRPMMYAALTYDHRLIDGSEAVTFLRHIKERIEDPARLVIDV